MGSAGQRHLRNLKQLASSDLELFALRTSGHNIVITDGNAEACGSLEAHYGFRSFARLDEALAVSPDIVFVTNPSSKHMEVALAAAEAGCDLFIEKPLSHSTEGSKRLRKLVDQKRLVVMVGFQTRFHPLYSETKAVLKSARYGDVLSAHFQWGTFLPDHHPYEDYRAGYAARRDLGGGVLFGLIHELDLICSFWGLPEETHSIFGNSRELRIDAEDTVLALMKFRDRGRTFPVSLGLSYAQANEERCFKVQFERATLYCDLAHQTLQLAGRGGHEMEKDFPNHSRNDLFAAEMREFLESVAERRPPSPGLEDGISSLTLAEMIKMSASRGAVTEPLVETAESS